MASGKRLFATIVAVLVWVTTVGILTAWGAGYFDSPREPQPSSPETKPFPAATALPPGHPPVPGFEANPAATGRCPVSGACAEPRTGCSSCPTGAGACGSAAPCEASHEGCRGSCEGCRGSCKDGKKDDSPDKSPDN